MSIKIHRLSPYCLLAFVLIVSACSTGSSNIKSGQGKSISLTSGNAEAGKAIFQGTCKTCHGDQGQGNKDLQAPNLSNHEGWYLQQQLINFQKGLRGYSHNDTFAFQMAVMAKTLKDSIAVEDVVAYIKILPRVAVSKSSFGDSKTGLLIYQSICGSCHGANGNGNEKLNAPRLNGLDDWYLKQQIGKFRRSERGAHPDDKLGAQMVAMTALLPDDKSADDVIAYITSVSNSVSK